MHCLCVIVTHACEQLLNKQHCVVQSFNPCTDYMIFGRVEGLHKILQTKGLHNPSKDWRIAFAILLILEAFQRPQAQSFEGLRDCMRDCIVLRRLEWLHVILQPFEGLWTYPHKDYAILGRVEGLHAILQTKGMSDLSKDWRIAFMILLILQAFQGLWMQSFEGLKDCMQSFNPYNDCKCDPSEG